jgi:hypothetical protein
MVRRKSLAAAELNTRLEEAVLGVQTGKYKSLYKAGKVLWLNKETIARCVNRGLSRSQAR